MIIVTGGAGFIGSNIVKTLNQIGHNDILVVDNLKNGKKCINLFDLNILDYMNKNTFIAKITANDSFSNIKVIFHEGACSSTTELNGNYMIDNNYQYSKTLLNYCVKHNIPFLYASSASVYGHRTSNFIEDRQYEQPLNIYSYSKFLFDQYVRSILPQAKSQICGLRYFNVYGPREEHKGNMASIAFNIKNQIQLGKNPKLFTGSENFKRDFIYIDDVVSVNLWFWQNNISGIFNCGSGQAESFQTIAKFVLDYYKKDQMEYIPFPKKLKGYYQKYTRADLTKLRAAGYMQTFKTVAEGMMEYLNWLLTHSN